MIIFNVGLPLKSTKFLLYKPSERQHFGAHYESYNVKVVRWKTINSAKEKQHFYNIQHKTFLMFKRVTAPLVVFLSNKVC